MKRIILIGLLAALYTLMTFIHWPTIQASFISLVTSVGLAFVAAPLEKLWQLDLLEFWIAAIVWFVAGMWVSVQLRRLFNRHTAKGRLNATAMFFAGMFFVATTTPFLVTIPPNVQGDLVTTRLLPPLARGTITYSENQDSKVDESSMLNAARINSNAILLQGNIRIVGNSVMQQKSNTQSIPFLFGTDDSGRDVFSRVLSGARVSLLIGILASIGSLLLGTLVGFASGYSNNVVDSLLMRGVDLLMAIPSLFLVIGIITFMGQSTTTLIIILALTGWMPIARTVRTEVRKLRNKEFVLAARMLNQGPMSILVHHIVPNLKPLLMTAVMLQFGNAVLAEASLGFLGLGVQPPTASWGNMLGQSLGYVSTGWWLAVFPGVVLTSVLVAIQYFVDRDSSPI